MNSNTLVQSTDFSTEDAPKSLVTSHILKWLDYHTCPFKVAPSSVTQPLKKVQNSATRAVLKRGNPPSLLYAPPPPRKSCTGFAFQCALSTEPQACEFMLLCKWFCSFLSLSTVTSLHFVPYASLFFRINAVYELRFAMSMCLYFLPLPVFIRKINTVNRTV